MELFASSFAEDLHTVVLTQNYRSVQNVLDASMTLIENNGNSRLVNQLPGLSKHRLPAMINSRHSTSPGNTSLQHQSRRNGRYYTRSRKAGKPGRNARQNCHHL
ncbi:hypothetical protein MKQ70_28950 [Chitinophaga sedimenti]|uniref:hypothetical protein n=1 Tax=Chitinophaga sedimenti TaxID=2033606 RepID=UPI002003ABDE|nr:hypothetical protein [Chitinophaga sedimenti]MCK7558795.1 hypothetical protein [Chitinophaga sedimenti]